MPLLLRCCPVSGTVRLACFCEALILIDGRQDRLEALSHYEKNGAVRGGVPFGTGSNKRVDFREGTADIGNPYGLLAGMVVEHGKGRTKL